MAALAAAIVLAGASSPVSAQSFPNKPLRVIVPYGATGSPDTLARLIGQKVSESVGQQVVIENRPGGSGIVAAELAMKAPPDGYTLFIADGGHMAVNPALRPNLPYVPLRDFAPVTLLISVPFYFIAVANAPFRTINEMIAASRGKEMFYGSSGNGSPHHLVMELFKSKSGAKLSHVPYKGNAQSVPALLSGDVQVLIAGMTSVRGHYDAGKLTMLGVTSAKRTPITPEVPTVAESLAGFEATDFVGFLVPAGTPRDVIGKLNTEIVKALKLPDVQQRVQSFAMDSVGSTPEQFADVIRQKQQVYNNLAKEVNLKVD